MERIARVESIDTSTGTFEMTLATEGEASDGHILSIAGGQIPERMPLLSSHWNEPTTALGSVTNPRKELKANPKRLKATGHIELEGEGAAAEIRRDLAHMIGEGHIRGVSIRWDEVPGKATRRVNLPSDHPFYVADTEKDHRKRFGLYFEEWRALEGSVVAVGADPAALIGRAEETEGEVRQFWRVMAGLDAPPDPVDLGLDPLPSSDSQLADAVHRCHEEGAEMADVLNLVAEGQDFQRVDVGDDTLYVPSRVADLLREQREPDLAPDPEPEPARDPGRSDLMPEQTAPTVAPYRLIPGKRVAELFVQAMDRSQERERLARKAAIDRLRGKVT